MRFRVVVMLLIALGLVVLFSPVPFIWQTQVLCMPCAREITPKCPRCPQKGDIGWKQSLFSTFLGRLSKSAQLGGEMEPL